jgi:hypothetical protein
MLLNSGNPSLLGQSRLYANDPSTAANTMWTDQQHKDQINVHYLQLRALARRPDRGWCRKRAYADGVAVDTPDDHFYSLPADFVGRLRVEISTNGSNLSTTLPSSDPAIKVLEPAHYDVALDAYNTDTGTSPRYVFIHDQHFGISPPLSSAEAGTKSIRITCEASSTLLTGDADEPDLNRDFHYLLALGAAMDLRMTRGLEMADLERRYEIGKIQFQRDAATRLADHDSQIAVAGRLKRTRHGTQTKVVRL